MKLDFTNILLATSLLSLISNVVALPSGPLYPRQQTDDTPQYGVSDGQNIPRREINDFLTDADLTTVYINGLSRMMNTQIVPTTSKLSFHAIAAIHGTNLNYWGIRQNGNGYCVHSSVHFPTWHRPYVALFEYAVWKHAGDWINTLNQNDKTRYSAALRRFRTPYWDWAKNSQMPNLMTQQYIQIFTSSSAGTTQIYNPLYSYRPAAYNSLMSVGNGAQTVESVRSPSVSASVYVSNEFSSQKVLGTDQSNWKNGVNYLFQSQGNWNQFATGGNSLEGLHGGPHLDVGNVGSQRNLFGHMYNIASAGWDPAFMLHHANVDRQLAIWQVINPNQYVSYTQNDVYYPFWDASRNSYQNPTDAKNVNNYHYTYPELQQATTSTAMKSLMSRMYGSNSPGNTVSRATGNTKRQTNGDENELSPVSNSTTVDNTAGNSNSTVAPATPNTDLSTPADASILASKGKASLLNDTSTYNEYQADITVPSSAVSGSFSLRFFVGSYTSDPSGWVTDPNYVGSMNFFTMGDKMSNQVDLKGNVFFTQAVLNLINRKGNGLEDLTVKNVRTFLKSNTKFEVQTSEGTTVDKSKFKIKIETAKVKTTKAASDSEPAASVWGPWRTISTLQ